MKRAAGNHLDERAQLALRALELNRQVVRATFAAPVPAGADTFPRSATFRWMGTHLRPRALLRNATAAALARIPLGRLLGRLLSERGN